MSRVDEPRIATPCGVDTVNIVPPNESVMNPVIEINVCVVYVLDNCVRKSSIKSTSVLTFMVKNITNRKMEVMNINDGDKRTNETMGALVIEPKGR